MTRPAHTVPRRFAKGFTLIELLVAISILAIVAVLGWRGLDSIVRARATMNEQLDETRGMQLALSQMQSDFARMASPQLIFRRAPLQADQDRLQLIRVSYYENQPPRLQVVTYRLQNGALTRQESAPTRSLEEIDSFWQAGLENTATTPTIPLQAGISAMTTRLWLNDRPGWRPTTGPSAITPAMLSGTAASVAAPPNGRAPNAASTQLLPTGLEITLQLRSNDTSITKLYLLGVV